MKLQSFSAKWGKTRVKTVDLGHKPKVVQAKVKSRIILYSRTKRIDNHVVQAGCGDNAVSE
jgi:hypothetical protein